MKDSTKETLLKNFLNFCDNLGQFELIGLTNDKLIQKFIAADRKRINSLRSTPPTSKDKPKNKSRLKRLKIALIGVDIQAVKRHCYENSLPMPHTKEFKAKYQRVLKEDDVRGYEFDDIIFVDDLHEIDERVISAAYGRIKHKFTHEVFLNVYEGEETEDEESFFIDDKKNHNENAGDATLKLIGECMVQPMPHEADVRFSANARLKVGDVVFNADAELVKIIKIKYFDT